MIIVKCDTISFTPFDVGKLSYYGSSVRLTTEIRTFELHVDNVTVIYLHYECVAIRHLTSLIDLSKITLLGSVIGHGAAFASRQTLSSLGMINLNRYDTCMFTLKPLLHS